MYPFLSGVLEGNPFSESSQLRVPDGLSNILEVLKEALDLLKVYQVHSDISLQLCAYLFFFINASLFNTLMERGSQSGFYQWSRGVQIRANLDLLMDWIQNVGLGEMASEFFQKLSSAVNLLATPRESLLQASWSSLRSEFPALNTAQLHYMLREYSSGKPSAPSWTPPLGDMKGAFRTADILQSFDSHPPLVLPVSSFHLELGKPLADPALFTQLAHLQEFIHHLPGPELGPESVPDNCMEDKTLSKTSDSSSTTFIPLTLLQDSTHQIDSDPETYSSLKRDLDPPKESAQSQGFHGDLSSCEAVLTQKLKNLELQNSLSGQADLVYHKSLALDPSCLLTPPNTPQGLELCELETRLQEGAHQLRKAGGCTEKQTESKEEEYELEEEEEESKEVFTVELHRGPHGLGLALVDGLRTPLRMSGIYVKSVVPDSPAAQCNELRTGDRVLAVNGISLVGMEYNIGRELIRSSGDSLLLLVAKINSKSSAMMKC